MLQFTALSLLLWCLSKTYALSDCPVEYHCNDTFIEKDDKVNFYCMTVYRQPMMGRCCIVNNSIIGVDFRKCDIKILNVSNVVYSEVEILDLRENNYQKFTSDELKGLLKLNYLYLEPNIQCPGRKDAWNITEYSKNETYCSHQIDYCESLKHMNITCGTGENAKCVRLGPGTAKCDCQPGYFGYKCLQRGTFPTAVFSTSVIIPTIVLSVVLWYIQGRDPYLFRSVIAN